MKTVGVGGSGRGRCHNSSGVSPVLKPVSVCDLTAALSAAPVSPPSVFITRGLTFVPGVRVDWRGCRQMPILTVFCHSLRCCSFVLSLVTTVYSRVLLSAGVGAGQRHNTGRHSSTYLALVQNTFCYVQLFDSGLSKSF